MSNLWELSYSNYDCNNVQRLTVSSLWKSE